MSLADSSDPRMKNGWAEYQRLVLAELERHNDLINQINIQLRDVAIFIALYKENSDKIEAQMKEFGEKIQKLQDAQIITDQGDAIGAAISKYRRWIIGIALTILVSVAIPVVNIFLNYKTGTGK